LPKGKTKVRSLSDGDAPAFNSTAVGVLVRTVREGRDMSQGDLASASGAAKQAISNLERGTVTPSIPTILAVSRSLGLDPLEVLRAGFGDVAEAEQAALRHQIQDVLTGLEPAKLELALAQVRALKAWRG
jgi:transcriptional regulator with XRE-family HTH domain